METTSELDPSDAAEVSASIANSVGRVVAGTYRLTRHIGSGGSSHVFEAEHVRLGKPFAVKILRPELDPNRQTAQRFRREARAIARLRSEYIVNVVDCGELDDHTPYLVTELLEGEDLHRLLKREGSLPARRAVPILVEACRALSEAHAAGLVHRDLKPENLFITRRAGGEDWCKVLDFGVAKMDASMATTEGAIVGTVRYMAPEQLADGANVGTAADIHALGAILYECLSGRPAHSGESIQEAMFSVLNKEPPPFEGAPQTLVALSRRCLSKDPTKRPPSARAFAEELSACLDARASDDPRSSREGAAETVAEDGPTPAISIAPVGKRRRRLSLPLTLGVGIILGGLASRQLSTARGDASAQVPSLASSALQRGRPGQATASPPRPAVTASTTAQPATPTASAAAPSIKPRATSPPRLGSSGASTLALSAAPQHAASIGSLDTANPYSE